MNEESFMNLVKENDGFEFVIGYKDFVDHRIGGLKNKYWYFIDYNGKKQEYYVGIYDNGLWTDKFYTKKGAQILSLFCFAYIKKFYYLPYILPVLPNLLV